MSARAGAPRAWATAAPTHRTEEVPARRHPGASGPSVRARWRAAAARWGASTLAGLAVAAVVGGLGGAVCGTLLVLGTALLLRRLPSADERSRRDLLAADLPLAADLLAAALGAGSPVPDAVKAVADALDAPVAAPLDRVARALRWGARPEEAWAHLPEVPGGRRIADTAVRSSAHGAALARALSRVADDLRADRRAAAETAAQRAGVLLVLPLGLCFLPAFILAGLVPVVIAVLDRSAVLF